MLQTFRHSVHARIRDERREPYRGVRYSYGTTRYFIVAKVGKKAATSKLSRLFLARNTPPHKNYTLTINNLQRSSNQSEYYAHPNAPQNGPRGAPLPHAKTAARKKPSRNPRRFFSERGAPLFGDALEPPDHRQHGEHRNGAHHDENGPRGRDRTILVEDRTDEEQAVAQGGGTEPAALHQALQLLRRDFRNERQAEGRDEELGDGQDQIGDDEQPRRDALGERQTALRLPLGEPGQSERAEAHQRGGDSGAAGKPPAFRRHRQ